MSDATKLPAWASALASADDRVTAACLGFYATLSGAERDAFDPAQLVHAATLASRHLAVAPELEAQGVDVAADLDFMFNKLRIPHFQRLRHWVLG